MKRKKIKSLGNKIESLRGQGGIKSKELESIAKSLGRIRHKRGKHTTWISPIFPDLRPISIQHHSKDPNRHVANNILNQLEIDLTRFEEICED